VTVETTTTQPAARAAQAARASLWGSTIGKKAVMAVTGLIMVVFLLLHMLGNLKIFFGPRTSTAMGAGCGRSVNPFCTGPGFCGCSGSFWQRRSWGT
jgi:hypothetical protein